MTFGLRNNTDFWAGMIFFWTGVGDARRPALPLRHHAEDGARVFPDGSGWHADRLRRVHHVQGSAPEREGTRALVVSCPDHASGLHCRLRDPDEAGRLRSGPGGPGFPVGGIRQRVQVQEVVLLAVFLSALSVAMFIWGLGLNYPLVGKF